MALSREEIDGIGKKAADEVMKQKCLCGSKAYFVGELLTFILGDLEEGKITSADDIEHLGAGIRGLQYCGIDSTKIEKRLDILKESLQRMAKAETSHKRHRARMDALLDHHNLEQEIGDTLGKCTEQPTEKGNPGNPRHLKLGEKYYYECEECGKEAIGTVKQMPDEVISQIGGGKLAVYLDDEPCKHRRWKLKGLKSGSNPDAPYLEESEKGVEEVLSQ